MTVLLYSEGQRIIKNSGIGKTRAHQVEALHAVGVQTTLRPEDHYDLLHINTTGPRSYALSKKASQNGIPVVYHAHSTEEDFRNSFVGSNLLAPSVRKWLIHCYTSGNVIITPTPYSKKLLINYGIQTPIYTVSNGVDLSFFKFSPEKRAAFRKHYHFSESDQVVIGVGLFIERKGILDFVEMAKRLPQYQFIWFGFTPLYSIPAKIRKAVHTKLPNLYFPGYISSEKLSEAYCGADLFWFPTHEETEGIVLLEAIASQQNVLVRDIPIYQDWLIHGRDVYKCRTMADFEKGILQILEGQLPSLKHTAYPVAQERSLEKVGAQLKEIYQSLL